jgi:hypothetical protein
VRNSVESKGASSPSANVPTSSSLATFFSKFFQNGSNKTLLKEDIARNSVRLYFFLYVEVSGFQISFPLQGASNEVCRNLPVCETDSFIVDEHQQNCEELKKVASIFLFQEHLCTSQFNFLLIVSSIDFFMVVCTHRRSGETYLAYHRSRLAYLRHTFRRLEPARRMLPVGRKVLQSFELVFLPPQLLSPSLRIPHFSSSLTHFHCSITPRSPSSWPAAGGL